MLLIIDGFEEWGRLLGIVMQGRGHSCVCRSRGAEGLQFLRSLPPGEPVLVLLDNDLQDMSGVDVLRTIGNESSPAHVSVVLCGSHLSAQVQAEARQLGVLDVLIKGADANLTLQQLADRIAGWYAQSIAAAARLVCSGSPPSPLHAER